jgi:PEGA domain
MPEANAYPATVVFFGLADFGAQPVAAQAKLKEGLEFALAAALAPIKAAERLIVDTRDGAAVVLLDEPDAALDFGNRVRAAAPALPLCIGINHGHVKLSLTDAHGPALVGDVLAAGAAVAGFAKPGTTLVSRSYRDALAQAAPHRAKSLRPAGVFTDAAVRSHEVFAPGTDAAVSHRRRLLVLGTIGVAGILAAGVMKRRARLHAEAAARVPAVVSLAITPGGEILVDGRVQGMTPPLKTLELAPGRHDIVVRTGVHTPLTTRVDLAPGERFTLQHDFPPPPPPPAPKVAEAPAKPVRPESAASPQKPQRPASATTTAKRQQPRSAGVKEDFREAGREMRDFFRGLVR